MAIYDNSSSSRTVRGAFSNLIHDVERLRLAAPFFSYADLLKEIGKGECKVDLIIRLGPATPPTAIRQVFTQPRLNIRYFTSSRFHTKLYIFGDRCALVGSANLTNSGMQSNQELAIEVLREAPEFDELVGLYRAYWESAEVMTEERLSEYEQIWDRHSSKPSRDRDLEADVKKVLGDKRPSGGIQVGERKPSGVVLELEDYRRSYQEFYEAYREVEELYVAKNVRRQPELPLRIEVDQFFNYIRETHAKGKTYLDMPLLMADPRAQHIRDVIDEWLQVAWPYLDEHIVSAYPIINNTLGSKQAIQHADYEELFEALDVCHSFNAQLRYHKGGKDTMRKEFMSSNSIERVKRTLTFLIHGEDEFVGRMGAVIYDPYWKLDKIARNVVQEIYGWVNTEGVPIGNERTNKCLRYLGFEIVT